MDWLWAGMWWSCWITGGTLLIISDFISFSCMLFTFRFFKTDFFWNECPARQCTVAFFTMQNPGELACLLHWTTTAHCLVLRPVYGEIPLPLHGPLLNIWWTISFLFGELMTKTYPLQAPFFCYFGFIDTFSLLYETHCYHHVELWNKDRKCICEVMQVS